jgi:hypothetical protein
MGQFQEMQVFFLISSVGFVVVFIFVAILLYYFIRATKTLERIAGKVEDDIDKIGDTTREIIEDMRDSAIFNFIFKRGKKRIKS